MKQVDGRQKASHRKASEPVGLVWPRAAFVALIGLLAYANSLGGPFIFDDHHSILENPSIREWWKVGTVLFPGRELPTAGRPLVNLSFAANYALGGLEVRGYHLFNIACHVLSGLLLFGIVRRTLQLPNLKARFDAVAVHVAFAASLLWTLHPLNTEAVDYLTQRTELMMALFYLLTLYAAVRAWGARPRTWQTVAVLSCAAGMACKESMVTAPVMVVLYDTVFVSGSLRRAFAARWRLWAGLFSSWIVLAALLQSGPRLHSAGFSSGVDPWTYLLNQTVLITRYLGLVLWPRALVAVYGWPAALTLGEVLPQALLLTSLLAVTIIALIRQPKWGFLGAWFFITLAPASSIVPIATEVGAERRMYLPLMAIVVLVVVGTAALVSSSVRRTRAGFSRLATAVAVTTAAALLFTGTFVRNRDYGSAVQLARTAVERYPTSVGHHFFGSELLLVGDREAGMAELRRAIPGAPRAHYTLGAELLKEGKTDEGIDELKAFVREQGMLVEAVSARLLLGQVLVGERRWLDAIEQGTMVFSMNPTDAERLEARALLADAFFGAERFDEAIVQAREYLRRRPDAGLVLTKLGVALIAVGKPDEAIAALRRVVELDPRNADARRNLANALYDGKNFVEAAAEAEQAVALRPADADACHLLGRSLAVLGRFEEARSYFERTLQIDPGHTKAQDDLRKLQTLMRR